MNMKLKVDKAKCLGCGLCVSTCEKVFDFDDDNLAKVVVDTIPEDDIEAAKSAKENCPAGAIEEE